MDLIDVLHPMSKVLDQGRLLCRKCRIILIKRIPGSSTYAVVLPQSLEQGRCLRCMKGQGMQQLLYHYITEIGSFISLGY